MDETTIDAVLADINTNLKTLSEAKAEGKSVDETAVERLEQEKERAESVKAALTEDAKSVSDSVLDELASLRGEKREREERDMARKAAVAALRNVQEEEKARGERIKSYAAEAIKEVFGGT